MVWLALAIGNSRYHWGWFIGSELQEFWHSDYLSVDDWPQQLPLPAQLASYLATNFSAPNLAPKQLPLADMPLCLASVVPAQTAQWQPVAQRVVALADVPLGQLYPTLGIDRALAAYGAGQQYGYPVLVIDGGTALTLTGIDGDRQLVGGAICPGLGLQLQSLTSGTAALPALELPLDLPPRWARNTPAAMISGVLHGSIASLQSFIQDWQHRFPGSKVLVTGGDGERLQHYLQQQQVSTVFSATLVLQGMAQLGR